MPSLTDLVLTELVCIQMHQLSSESQLPAAEAADSPSSSVATASVMTAPETESSVSLAAVGSQPVQAPVDVEDDVVQGASASTAASDMSLEEKKQRFLSLVSLLQPDLVNQILLNWITMLSGY